MSAGSPRRGRRDNGLDAAEFAVAGDVDPRVGEHLLDVLAAGGIAAYLQPSADLNPVTRTTTVPARPTDRLYVDRSHLATARDYLSQLAEESGPAEPTRDSGPAANHDFDSEWARIVAGYHTQVDPATQPWPAAENLPVPEVAGPAAESTTATTTTGTDPASDESARKRPPAPGTGTTRLEPDPTAPATSGSLPQLPYAGDVSGISVGSRSDQPSLLDGLDTFGADLPGEPEDRYVPPPPPPLPQVSKYAVVGVLAITIGFTLFLFPSLLPIDHGMATLIGFTGVLTGFVTLIWRLRPGDEEDDDPGDGAVV